MAFTNDDKLLLKEKLSDYCRACVNEGKCGGNEEVDCPACPIEYAYDMISDTEFEEEA